MPTAVHDPCVISRDAPPSKTASRQYAHLYFSRLVAGRRRLEKSWPDVKAVTLAHLKPDVLSCVAGTIYKEQTLKPSILHRLADELELKPHDTPSSLMSDDDYLILEDEQQRVKLRGELQPSDFVTGVLVALLGTEPSTNLGVFIVKDVAYLSIDPPPPLPQPAAEAGKVLLLSGLAPTGRLTMLTDWLTGVITGGPTISCVVIAGGLLAPGELYSLQSTAALERLDCVLALLSAHVRVIVLPSGPDPANAMYPQRPLHPALLPKARRSNLLTPLCNPGRCEIDGVEFIIAAGETLTDITRSTAFTRLEAMSATLRWGHLCPSAPDTLATYPSGGDGLAVTAAPHVYISGGGSELESVLEDSTLLVSLPDFAKTGVTALLDLADLSLKPFTILPEDE